MQMTTRDVPCNGCTACCRAELIMLHPEDGDDVASYETVAVINPVTGQPGHAVQRAADGTCIYLGPSGCTIHDRAPVICREFDCRRFFLKFPRPHRRQMMKADPSIGEMFAAGRERLDTLRGKF